MSRFHQYGSCITESRDASQLVNLLNVNLRWYVKCFRMVVYLWQDYRKNYATQVVGLQEELRYPGGYTPRGFTSSPGPGREAKYEFSGLIPRKDPRGETYLGGPKEKFGLMIFEKNPSWGTVLKLSQRHQHLLVEVRHGDVGVAPERVMYMRLPLQVRFTLDYIKALSKTLPNIHWSSRVPAPHLTSTRSS